MGAGKLIAIIGGILGILCVALFHVLPDIFSFWRIEGVGIGWYLGGFAFWDFGVGDPQFAEDILILVIFVLIVAGGGVEIIGALIENKAIATIGGLLMLIGPILFIVALVLELGDFKGLADFIESGTGERFLLFGSGAGANWGLWISTYLALGAGVLGIIGGASIERYNY